MNIDFKHLGSAFFESDKQEEPAPPAPVAPAAPQPVPQPVSLDTADRSDDAYQRLFAKTDFTTTPVYTVLQKYLAPLAPLGLDEKTKFRAALSQAQAIDKLDPQSVVTVFDTFIKTLEDERQRFESAVTNAAAARVDAKKAQAAAIATQILQLQAQAQQLSDEAFADQQKFQTAQHRFEQAMTTRQTELAAEQSKYASLLA